MVRFNETTCVKINKEKKDLAKSKGLKLQDILDNALNDALSKKKKLLLTVKRK